MKDKNLSKKVIVKVILSLVFIIILIIQYFYLLNTPYGETNSILNTSDARMELDPIIFCYNDINYFFKCVENKEYNKAYNLLSDECKNEEFQGKFEMFLNEIKSCINTDICNKKVQYVESNETKENGKKVYNIKSHVFYESMNENYKGKLDTEEMMKFFAIKSFNFKIIEEKPFNYKIYLNIGE